jgi:cobalamin biosynthesis Mg chelatase CobN
MPTKEEVIIWAMKNDRCTINDARRRMGAGPLWDGDVLFSERFGDVEVIPVEEAKRRDREMKAKCH